MKFDKQIKVIKQETVEDGMGGFENGAPVVIAQINGFTTPVKAEVALKDYGLVTTSAMKIFTKDEVPEEFDHLEYSSKKYEVLQLADFGKIRMLLVQVIQNG